MPSMSQVPCPGPFFPGKPAATLGYVGASNSAQLFASLDHVSCAFFFSLPFFFCFPLLFFFDFGGILAVHLTLSQAIFPSCFRDQISVTLDPLTRQESACSLTAAVNLVSSFLLLLLLLNHHPIPRYGTTSPLFFFSPLTPNPSLLPILLPLSFLLFLPRFLPLTFAHHPPHRFLHPIHLLGLPCLQFVVLDRREGPVGDLVE